MKLAPHPAEPPAAPSGAGRPPRWKETGLAFAVFTLLAVVLTWPLVESPRTRVPLGAHDLWQNYWNLWWWKTAFVDEGRCPYHSDRIFAPMFPAGDAPLGLHTNSPANAVLTLPVNAAFGPAAALNAAVFLGFVLAGFGAYLLAREYVPGRAAPYLAGIVFAYFPQHVEQSLEHLNLASTEGLPLALWGLIRLVRGGGWKRALACGALFAFNALLSWHYALMVIVPAAALAVFEALGARRRLLAIAGDLAGAALAALLLVSPALWHVFETLASGAADLQKERVDKSIDPLFLIIPHGGHPLWESMVSGIYKDFRSYPSVGFTAYLGVVAIGLALAAPLARRAASTSTPRGPRGAAVLWLALGAFFLVLSFGERFIVARQKIEGLPLPFDWLQELPIFGLVRVSNRFLIVTALALAVLASMGGGAIARLLPARAGGAFVAAAAALLVGDYLWLPYPTRELPRTDWISLYDSLPPDAIVLDLPSGFSPRAAEDMFLQTRHRRRIATGYLATRLKAADEALQRYPVLRQFLQRPRPKEAPAGPSLSQAIRELGIDAVVLHRDRTVTRILEARDRAGRERPHDLYRPRIHNPEIGVEEHELEAFRSELRASFGPPIAQAEGAIEIYRVPSPEPGAGSGAPENGGR